MASVRTLIIAGTVTLVAGLIIAFPARIAYQWVAPPAVALRGISGSVWHGRATEASIAGMYFTDVQWRFRPLAILTGRAEFAVSAAPVSGFAEADISVSPSGTVQLSNVAASVPVTSLERIVAVAGIDGNLSLKVARLVIENGIPVKADGEASVSDLVIRPFGTTPLGNFRATFETVEGTIRGNVEDVSGVLDVAGTLEVTADRSYAFTGLIGTRAGAPAVIDEQLRYLGSADTEGRRQFRLEGQL